MAIPDFQSIMLPLLQFASDGKEHSTREAIEALAAFFTLSDDELSVLLPSGKQAIFDNRVNWASTYLRKTQLLESSKRGYFVITERGVHTLEQNPSRIDIKFLRQFPELDEFRRVRDRNGISSDISDKEDHELVTPQESIEFGYRKIREELEIELLRSVMDCSPTFFEQLVVDLLVKMGYGGSRLDAAQRIGKTGDGGIDGIIKEDKLGLDIVYIQAKRWEGTVGRPDIQKFAGALQGQRARKGIFITTSSFSKDAHEYVSLIDSKIVLIDGQELAQLMLDYNIGVSLVTTYEIKRIDSDYFVE